MIRLPQIPGLQPTAINAPEASSQAAMAPAHALGNVAEAIAGVSDHFQQAAQRVNQMENGRLLSEKRQQLYTEYTNFQLELNRDPDPASRIKKTQDFFTNFKGNIDDPQLPQDVQYQFRNHFDEFATKAMIRQGEDSANLAAKRGMLTLDNEINSGIKTKSPQTVENAVSTALQSGFILPEQADKIREQANKQFKVNAITEHIDRDPLASERALNDPKFSEDHPELDQQTTEHLKSIAEHKANRFRSDFADDVIVTGKTPTPQELQAMRDAGQLSASQHAQWLTQIRSTSTPLHDPALYETAYTQITAYNPARDPSGQTEAMLRNSIAAAALPPEDKKVLNDKLKEIINPTDSKTPKGKLEPEFAAKIHADFNQGEFGKFRFPMDDDNNPLTPPVMTVSPAEYTKAWALRGKFAEQWRGILGTMPSDASFEQINTAYDKLRKEYKDKKPLPTLNFSKPSPLGFDPDQTYNATKQQTFGGQSIKAPGGTYTNAMTTVFGGTNDPADNGKSAFGGQTGNNGKEGTAIPESLLETKFPGKSKAWIAENVRTVVKGPDGLTHVFPVVDFGTAEDVWTKNGAPTLDLTEGAARQMGGKPTYTKAGHLKGLSGIPAVDFSVVSIDTNKKLSSLSWEEAKNAWFKQNAPRTTEQATNGMLALREAWNLAHANEADPEETLKGGSNSASDALLPPKPIRP